MNKDIKSKNHASKATKAAYADASYAAYVDRLSV